MTTITDDTQTEIIAKPYSKIRAAYDPIAETWKAAEAERPFLPITQEIAWKVINKSKRFLWGRRYTKISKDRVIITSGRNHTYCDGYSWRVNPDRSWSHGGVWQQLCHAISHFYSDRMLERGHSKKHARLELKLAKMMIRRGWMYGTLEREAKPIHVPTADEARSKKIELRKSQIVRLERKAKRLSTMLKKAKRSLRMLELHAANVTA